MWEVNAPYLLDGEEFIFKAEATQRSGISVAGGVLFLTSLRLVFKGRGSLFTGNDEATIFLRDIAEIKVAKSPLGIPFGFAAVTKAGTQMKFVVRKRQEWINMVQQQMAKAK